MLALEANEVIRDVSHLSAVLKHENELRYLDPN